MTVGRLSSTSIKAVNVLKKQRDCRIIEWWPMVFSAGHFKWAPSGNERPISGVAIPAEFAI